MRRWIRKQRFYNGELYLVGGSHGASLHYSTAPFEEDIKGDVLEIQDEDRYRLWCRNGQMRKGHANWHFGLYKSKCGLDKTFNMRSFSRLPLKHLSQRVLGDHTEDFEQMLECLNPTDSFWRTRNGVGETKNAAENADIPILTTTGYNDFYVGGIFKMWQRLSEERRKKFDLLVSPYNHGDGYNSVGGMAFTDGRRSEHFGGTYPIAWIDNIRLGTAQQFEKGVVSYYRTFENRWGSDFYSSETTPLTTPLGDEENSFVYDPFDPPAFCEEGNTFDLEEQRTT